MIKTFRLMWVNGNLATVVEGVIILIETANLLMLSVTPVGRKAT